jgi:beta-lactamase regulating signal transducer with metallopeptidase domain
MLTAHLLADVLRGAVLLGAALAAMPLLGRSTSAVRRMVLVLALGGALVLPIVAAVAPAWSVRTPAAVASLRGVITVDPPVDGSALAPALGAGLDAAPGALRGGVATSTRLHLRFDWQTLVATAWALGALPIVARLCLGLVRARRIVRRSVAAPSWSRAIAEAEAVLGRRATVRMTSELDAPAVTGVLTPVILVPRAADSWSDARRRAVLLHELAHVEQWDCAAGIVAQLACAVHWFDPLAWLAVRRLRLERELAADDAVIAAGARASAYAEDLLAIAGIAAPGSAPAGVLGMADRSELATRITAIVSSTRARGPLSRARGLALVAGAAALVLLVACATPASAPSVAVASPATPQPSPAPSAPAASGSTIDPRIQAVAEQELDRLVREWTPAAAAILVLDPASGEIVANAGRAHGAPADVAIANAYVTGSTAKAFTLSAALEEGVLSPTERIDCDHGKWSYQGKEIHDATPTGTVTIPEMLAVSSNVGFAKVFDRLGSTRLDHWFRAFHFGVAPNVAGANGGSIPATGEEKSFAGAMMAIGESMMASPLQVAAGYATIANGGAYVPPTLSRRTGAAPREQVLKPETAREVVSMLEEAVNGADATGKLAQISGQKVAGKTGTAAWDLPGGGEGTYASFVGFVPSTAPRFVILVGVEQPREGAEYGGGKVAAPVFARVATRALAL